jgi:predicted nuclease of predicted toxin-antitoxin system
MPPPSLALSMPRAGEMPGSAARDSASTRLASAPDEQIALRAKETSSVLLSRDLDFADIRRYPPIQYAGIVVLRLSDDDTAVEIVAAIARFFREHQFLDALKGRLAIVENDRVRFRPPLA